VFVRLCALTYEHTHTHTATHGLHNSSIPLRYTYMEVQMNAPTSTDTHAHEQTHTYTHTHTHTHTHMGSMTRTQNGFINSSMITAFMYCLVLQKHLVYEEIFGQTSPTNCTVYCGGIMTGLTGENIALLVNYIVFY